MSNQNDLVIVRRGDVEALKQEAIFGVFRRDAVEWDKLNALLSNAPVVSGEPVAYRHLHEDGWEYYDAPTGSDCSSCKALFTTPQPAPSEDDVRDAERYRWLVADHDNKDTRQKCRDLLSRLGVMSYSAASSEIDQAIAQEVK